MYAKHAIGDVLTEINPVEDETTSYEDAEDMEVDFGKNYIYTTFKIHVNNNVVQVFNLYKM